MLRIKGNTVLKVIYWERSLKYDLQRNVIYFSIEKQMLHTSSGEVVKAKGFLVLLNKEADRTILHSPLNM